MAIGVGMGAIILGLAAYQQWTHPPQSQPEILAAYPHRPRLVGSALILLQVQTAAGLGSVQLQLEGDSAPLTAGHFLDLVTQGFYDGLQFHRVEKDPEPFVVQGGEVNEDQSVGQSYTETGALQLRGIPLEIQIEEEEYPRYNELIDVTTSGVTLALPHEVGAIAMARSTALDSAASQFYITLAKLPILDGRYAVFGYVVEGIEWVDQIQVGDTIVSAEVLEGLENLVYPHP